MYVDTVVLQVRKSELDTSKNARNLLLYVHWTSESSKTSHNVNGSFDFLRESTRHCVFVPNNIDVSTDGRCTAALHTLPQTRQSFTECTPNATVVLLYAPMFYYYCCTTVYAYGMTK